MGASHAPPNAFDPKTVTRVTGTDRFDLVGVKRFALSLRSRSGFASNGGAPNSSLWAAD